MPRVPTLFRHLRHLNRSAARSMAFFSTSAAALNMTAYSSTISSTAESGPVPKDGVDKLHHVIKGGRLKGFRNPYPSFGGNPGFFHIWKIMMWKFLTGDLKMPDTTPPHVTVRKPTFLPSRAAGAEGGNLRATWLGHACYYVEFPSGLRVLFDPVFEDRCSPFSFLGPKRYTEPACAIADLPAVDAVFISHSHYDHLSHGSVHEIQKLHPRAHFFVGKGLETWFKNSGLRNVTEMDWWEDVDFTLTAEGDGVKAELVGSGNGSGSPDPKNIAARISCTPSQHNSARHIFDKDTTLWCSWVIKSGGKSVWFGGDTGYRAVPSLAKDIDDYGPDHESLPRCPQFKEIGELRGPFDLGLIPIGAYSPRVAFSPMHANPFDSVEIFKDTKCARAMGIHWGTWALTMEEVLEPPKLLKEALRRKGIPETGVFDVCDIGDSREF